MRTGRYGYGRYAQYQSFVFTEMTLEQKCQRSRADFDNAICVAIENNEDLAQELMDKYFHKWYN